MLLLPDMGNDPRLREPWHAAPRARESGFITALVIKLSGGALSEEGASKLMIGISLLFFILTVILLYRAVVGEAVKPLPTPPVPTETPRRI